MFRKLVVAGWRCRVSKNFGRSTSQALYIYTPLLVLRNFLPLQYYVYGYIQQEIFCYPSLIGLLPSPVIFKLIIVAIDPSLNRGASALTTGK